MSDLDEFINEEMKNPESVKAWNELHVEDVDCTHALALLNSSIKEVEEIS